MTSHAQAAEAQVAQLAAEYEAQNATVQHLERRRSLITALEQSLTRLKADAAAKRRAYETEVSAMRALHAPALCTFSRSCVFAADSAFGL